ncbi:class I SAM-dependent RNA methyltransferase, partial [Bordetella pertussis]
MPTDDKARPRKTLTIKKTAPAAPSADDEAPRRKRIGARARLVAQMERAKEQQHA